jgi:hydroxymethylpyrimidine kinase/phosphomethylpyrimidine kinase
MNEFKKIAGKPVVLTIAGLDPSGGAGVIADIRAIAAFDCLSSAAITSLTFQNDEKVWGAEHVSATTLRAQIAAVVGQRKVAAVKTGMLPTRELVTETARFVQEASLPAPVIDPVIRSTSGFALIAEGALETLIEELLPLARVITPNIPEAEQLTGRRIINEADMRIAAGAIRELGARAVLIKGGHLPEGQAGTEAIDLLDDDGEVTVFRGPWIEGANVRGTGCLLSAAIAAALAKELDLQVAVAQARDFVRLAISRANDP